MEFKLLVLRCNDIEKTKHFYESIGAEFEKEKHGSGPYHYASMSFGFVFELYPLSAGQNADQTRLGFAIDELDTVLNNIENVGQYEFNGQIVSVVLDPDGRKVEITKKS